ncbi:glutamate receptor ionotropic, kainate 2 isoform X3 [Drosophila mojavensis]|uniref:glutamate receptor ionotropic, kainate 2 isoform X3 n=2 Tax=Drosophila mojavensis TaxID=7230 RepID=UPI0013EE5E4D|nr:glutamate receptor ionotropic, kainate 2 isoform X3 [Drosophila mojavensis]
MMSYLTRILLSLNLFTYISSNSEIKIGALFPTISKQRSDPEVAFQYAVHRVNNDKSLLPDLKLIHNIQYIGKDSFQTVQKVCNLIEYGVQALFSPTDSLLATHINSICDDLDIPDIGIGRSAQEFSINVHPSQQYINQAFIDVIRYLNWTRFGILYEKDHGILILNEFSRSIQAELHIRQVSSGSYLTVLNEFKSNEIHNILIDTNSAGISILLKNILQQQMNEYKFHYFFTSFDLENFDLEDFKYNFVNITSFRLVDMGDVAVKEILKDIEYHNRRLLNHNESTYKSRKAVSIETEAALMFDAVYVFAIGLQSIYPLLKLPNLTCDDEVPWNGGLSLINYINAVEWKGLTGPIQFKEGQRIQFKLDLIKLKQHSIVKVGEWTPHNHLNITEPSLFFDAGSMNVTLVVITILETPYVMMRYGKNYTGNERFYGFCVDILEHISHEVGFDYILDLVPDRKYGAKDPETGQWNGMVAQLMKYKADLAVGSMTITYARESVIDFTKPFMNLGISILFKTEISYGTLESGSTMTFFRDSMIETYKKMWRVMDNKKPMAFTSTYEDGIRRVNQGNYAFLMESTMLDYIVQRDCNLTQIGGLLDTKGYGIATPKGSPWRDKISLAILELQEKGDIQMLYDKWWKNTDETCKRITSNKQSKANALGLDSIGGVFVVLLTGILVAFIVSFLEFIINFRQQAKLMRINQNSCKNSNHLNYTPVKGSQTTTHLAYLSPPRSLWVEMFEELRFAFWCTNKRQRPELNSSCAQCQK